MLKLSPVEEKLMSGEAKTVGQAKFIVSGGKAEEYQPETAEEKIIIESKGGTYFGSGLPTQEEKDLMAILSQVREEVLIERAEKGDTTAQKTIELKGISPRTAFEKGYISEKEMRESIKEGNVSYMIPMERTVSVKEEITNKEPVQQYGTPSSPSTMSQEQVENIIKSRKRAELVSKIVQETDIRKTSEFSNFQTKEESLAQELKSTYTPEEQKGIEFASGIISTSPLVAIPAAVMTIPRFVENPIETTKEIVSNLEMVATGIKGDVPFYQGVGVGVAVQVLLPSAVGRFMPKYQLKVPSQKLATTAEAMDITREAVSVKRTFGTYVKIEEGVGYVERTFRKEGVQYVERLDFLKPKTEMTDILKPAQKAGFETAYVRTPGGIYSISDKPSFSELFKIPEKTYYFPTKVKGGEIVYKATVGRSGSLTFEQLLGKYPEKLIRIESEGKIRIGENVIISDKSLTESIMGKIRSGELAEFYAKGTYRFIEKPAQKAIEVIKPLDENVLEGIKINKIVVEANKPETTNIGKFLGSEGIDIVSESRPLIKSGLSTKATFARGVVSVEDFTPPAEIIKPPIMPAYLNIQTPVESISPKISSSFSEMSKATMPNTGFSSMNQFKTAFIFDSKSGLIQDNIFKPAESLKQPSMELPKMSELSITGDLTGSPQLQLTRQSQSQKTTESSLLKPSYEQITRPSLKLTGTPNPKLTIPFLTSDNKKKKKKSEYLPSLFSREYSYTPSLVGIVSGKSILKAPKRLTGLEVRYPLKPKR